MGSTGKRAYMASLYMPREARARTQLITRSTLPVGVRIGLRPSGMTEGGARPVSLTAQASPAITTAAIAGLAPVLHQNPTTD